MSTRRNHLTKTAAGLALLAALSAAPALHAACNHEAGMAAFRDGDRATATKLLEACVEAGEHTADARFHLGILARNAKELDTAEAELAEAVRLDPERIAFRLEWAVTLEWLSRLDDAKRVYKEALELEPGNLSARLGIARMEHWQGHLRRSLALYRELLLAFPGDRGVRSGLAFALMADNKVDESRDLFEQLLADNPDDTSARKGLDMLANLRTRKLESHAGKIRDAFGRDIRQFRVSYTSTPSYAFKWGFELTDRDGFVLPPDGSGVPNNRAIKSTQALFGEYRFNTKTSVFGSLRREELLGDEDQRKLHLEVMHKPGERHRLFAGAIPAWIDGKHVNTLSYAGYVFQSDSDWSAMAQYYYGWDRQFPDSQALSLSWTRSYAKNSWLRLGASASKTAGDRTTSAFFNVRHYLSRDFALSASLVNNFSTDEREINLGVIYEF
jgi:Flp pilus assembly protein TadD